MRPPYRLHCHLPRRPLLLFPGWLSVLFPGWLSVLFPGWLSILCLLALLPPLLSLLLPFKHSSRVQSVSWRLEKCFGAWLRPRDLFVPCEGLRKANLAQSLETQSTVVSGGIPLQFPLAMSAE